MPIDASEHQDVKNEWNNESAALTWAYGQNRMLYRRRRSSLKGGFSDPFEQWPIFNAVTKMFCQQLHYLHSSNVDTLNVIVTVNELIK